MGNMKISSIIQTFFLLFLLLLQESSFSKVSDGLVSPFEEHLKSQYKIY